MDDMIGLYIIQPFTTGFASLIVRIFTFFICKDSDNYGIIAIFVARIIIVYQKPNL